MAVTLKFLSEKANLSTTTVSLILNGKNVRVSEAKKKRVLQLAKEYNYIPNSLAVGLVTKKTKTIGLIIPDISNIFFAEIAKNIEQEANLKGYSVILCNTNDKLSEEIKYANLLFSKGVDALVICPAIEAVDRFDYINKYIDARKGVIVFDRFFSGMLCSSVITDNLNGSIDAVKYLIKKGHTKIGCITGPLNSYSARLRIEGYRKALQDANIEINEDLIVAGDYKFESGYHQGLKIMEKDITAVFVCNDLMAYGFYHAAKKLGKKIPHDISIIGFDDLLFSSMLDVPLTSHNSWNGPEEYRGKFLGLTVEGTTYEGVTTGFDHIKELGVTHVQLLPIFDFGVIDEANPKNSFNWGYMPINFNVPEGSYSTDPFDGIKRIVELKQTTTAFNNNNIGVIMDVVYNHTGKSADSNFNLILPGYYFRMNEDGSFSNGSGTGNETASERYMMRKFMIDSVVFWATEYNLSGFRFDLMALHDVTTMNLIVQKLHEIDENILIYGEPWNGGATPLDPSLAADKTNLSDMPDVGAFNDEIRDGIKGSVFAANDKGFIQGNGKSEVINKVKYGVVGGVEHPDVTSKGLSNAMFWHTSPTKTINYVSAHDNNTLYDKIILSTTSKQRDLRDDMQKQANAIVLTSQGVVFLHAGVEFMRSKPKVGGGYDENSYESPDSTNQLRWDLKAKEENLACFEYYKGLISLRKAHPAFRMANAEDVIDNVRFLYEDVEGIIAYTISNYANNDTWGTILVIHNNCNKQLVTLTLPAGVWNLVANNTKISPTSFKTYEEGASINIFAAETVILYQGERVIASGCSSCASGSIINYVSMSMAFFILAFFRRKKSFIVD
jgi:type I pullulanase